MNKFLAVVVFLILFFPATYFAKVHQGGGVSVLLGYALGAAAFIFAAMIWNWKAKQ